MANDAPKAVAPPPASGLQVRFTPVPVLAPEGGQPEAGIFSILSRYAVMQVVLAFTALVRNKVVALRLESSAFDLLVVFVWVIGAPLLAAGDRLLWFSLELIQAAARWAIALLLLPHLGGLAVVIGFLAAVALPVALTFAVFRLRYGLHLAPKHVYRPLVGLAFVAFLAFTGAHASVSVPAMSAAVALWLAYAAYHVRRTGIIASLQRHFQSD